MEEKVIIKNNSKNKISSTKPVIQAPTKKQVSTIDKSKMATSDKKIIVKGNPKPVIQVLPKEQKSITEESKREETNVSTMDDELIIQSNPKSRISEAIKSIKTNLQFTAIDQNIKTLMITSSVPGEGKSFIAANLACAFANSDVKVLLIDCDLRKGRQHQIFKVSNAKGLSNLLIDDISIRQNYIKDTKIKNVKIIPSGVIPPNPSELLGSKKNKKLIEALESDFDLIILDCPPVNGLADALVMTSLVDSVIIVCAQNRTKTSLLNETKKALNQLNAKVTGVIMNRVDVKDSDDYYRYYE